MTIFVIIKNYRSSIPYAMRILILIFATIAILVHGTYAMCSTVVPLFDSYPPELSELNGHGKFIISMCIDLQHRTWIGTEEEGVWCYDPVLSKKKRWKHYTVVNGLGDNNGYALCCDRLGRVWVGHARSGMSVFNGATWKHYNQVTGPLGAHVYAIAVSPRDGDIWSSTELGLCRYRETTRKWQYYIAPQGLSLANASGIAFDRSGNIVVGFQREGIAIGDASTDFERWTHVLAFVDVRHVPIGEGLPSNQINCLLTDNAGNIWAGTHNGLAESLDGGISWRYIRGSDYKNKINGLYVNRKDEASLCGFELMPSDSKGRAVISNAYVAVDASQPPKDQLGVHIEVQGGQFGETKDPIKTQKTQYPVPQSIYQHERRGEFTYKLSNLVPRMQYILRLHFAELDYDGPAEREFDVVVNGIREITDLDIFKEAGQYHTALIKSLIVSSDSKGMITLKFAGRPAVSGLEEKENNYPAGQLMTEDYVTSLAKSNSGKLFVGHWEKGLEIYDPVTKTFSASQTESGFSNGITKQPQNFKADYVFSILPLNGDQALLGCYGDGLRIASIFATHIPVSRITSIAKKFVTAPLPLPASPPKVDEIKAVLSLANNPALADLQPGDASYIGADWASQGDWIGRYGSRYAVLCGADSPLNHEFYNDFSYHVDCDLGPNRSPWDGVRRWIHWLRTKDQRVLYDPVIGARRESEWDDHGESYPTSMEGPDLWVSISVPSGLHQVSAYFMNKDGHDGNNRRRDYLVDLLPWKSNVQDLQRSTPLAEARVRNFFGGVHQNFVLVGPAKFFLHIVRNNSFNTIVSSIMIDKLTGPPTEYETKYPGLHCIYFFTKKYDQYIAPPDSISGSLKVQSTNEYFLNAWANLYALYKKQLLVSSVPPSRILCYRALAASAHEQDENTDAILAWWRRSLPMETDEDRKAFTKSMADMFADELKLVPSLNRSDL